MAEDKRQFEISTFHSVSSTLKLSLKAFEEKVAHYGMTMVSQFLRSREFKEKYRLKLDEKTIEVK